MQAKHACSTFLCRMKFSPRPWLWPEGSRRTVSPRIIFLPLRHPTPPNVPGRVCRRVQGTWLPCSPGSRHLGSVLNRCSCCGLAVRPQCTNEGGVNHQLGATKQREALHHHLKSSTIPAATSGSTKSRSRIARCAVVAQRVKWEASAARTVKGRGWWRRRNKVT